MFFVQCAFFVCSKQECAKPANLITIKLGRAGAREEPMKFWSGSESRGKPTNLFSLSLML